MATHKDDKKSDNVAKKKRPNAHVLSKAERVKMEKRKEARRKAKKKIKISQITDQSGITTVCMKIRTLVVSFFILSAI